MKYLKVVIYVWGGCDLLYFIFLCMGCIAHDQIPFAEYILLIIDQFKSSNPVASPYIIVIMFVFDISTFVSGYFLVKQHTLGAVVSYIQVPFRLFLLHPSITLVGTQVSNPIVKKYVVFFVMFELLKLFSVIAWHSYKIKQDKSLEQDRALIKMFGLKF